MYLDLTCPVYEKVIRETESLFFSQFVDLVASLTAHLSGSNETGLHVAMALDVRCCGGT
jgi:hypothetical protein